MTPTLPDDYFREITMELLDYCRVTDGIKLVHHRHATINTESNKFAIKVNGWWASSSTLPVVSRAFAYAVIAQAARVCTIQWHRVSYRKYNSKSDVGAELLFWSSTGQHCGTYRIPFNPLPGDAAEATLEQYTDWEKQLCS